MRIVLTHPDMGVYLGNCLGLGFWTLLDTAGQQEAVTFPDIDTARAHIRSWEANADPAAYDFVPVDCIDYATIADLAKAGLGPMLGDMLNNLPCRAAA
jgi:hypothetical protein